MEGPILDSIDGVDKGSSDGSPKRKDGSGAAVVSNSYHFLLGTEHCANCVRTWSNSAALDKEFISWCTRAVEDSGCLVHHHSTHILYLYLIHSVIH